MGLVNLFMDKRPRLGHVVLDATVSENHNRSAEKSPYPVEEGADQSDHRRVNLMRVTLEGLISNVVMRPGGLLGGVVAGAVSGSTVGSNLFGLDFDPARHITAWRELEGLHESSEPLIVMTTLQVYPTMQVINLDATRDFENSDTLRFTVELEELRTAFTTFAEAKVAEELADLAADVTEAGGQTTTPATEAETQAALAALASATR